MDEDELSDEDLDRLNFYLETAPESPLKAKVRLCITEINRLKEIISKQNINHSNAYDALDDQHFEDGLEP